MEALTMSKRERLKLDVMQRLGREEISRAEAGRILDVSTRHVYRVYRRWREVGDRGVIHRARGGHSGRSQLEKRNDVLRLYASSYSDYGPSYFCEVMFRTYGLKLHRETVRRWLIDAGLWKREERGRRHRSHRRARPRKAALGMMLQLDGSPHDWFEGRNPKLQKATLLVLIDDASSRTMLRFRPTEDAQGVFLLLQDYFQTHGLPQSLYVDHGSVYWTEDGTTQFQRAMQELGIEVIHAHSPQAKGRVERANKTHQDRLIKALRQAKIATIDDANRFLEEEYTPSHNRRFAKTTGLKDVHRSIKGLQLERLLCFQEERVLQNDYTIMVKTIRYQIERPNKLERYRLPSPGAKVLVRIYLDGSVHCFCNEQELRITRVTEREAREQGRRKLPGRAATTGFARNSMKKRLLHLPTPQ
jgi:transposase